MLIKIEHVTYVYDKHNISSLTFHVTFGVTKDHTITRAGKDITHDEMHMYMHMHAGNGKSLQFQNTKGITTISSYPQRKKDGAGGIEIEICLTFLLGSDGKNGGEKSVYEDVVGK